MIYLYILKEYTEKTNDSFTKDTPFEYLNEYDEDNLQITGPTAIY